MKSCRYQTRLPINFIVTFFKAFDYWSRYALFAIALKYRFQTMQHLVNFQMRISVFDGADGCDKNICFLTVSCAISNGTAVVKMPTDYD